LEIELENTLVTRVVLDDQNFRGWFALILHDRIISQATGGWKF
jgi:hypothetical protein